MERFAAAGLEVAVTELDIRITLPATEEDLSNQAAQYAQVVKACVNVKKCVGVVRLSVIYIYYKSFIGTVQTTWGITDVYSWIPSTFTGEGAALIFDEQYRKKPAFQSTIDAF